MNNDDLIYRGHKAKDHVIDGEGRDRDKQIIAKYLCGWVTGHGAPLGHFDRDAEMLLKELGR